MNEKNPKLTPSTPPGIGVKQRNINKVPDKKIIRGFDTLRDAGYTGTEATLINKRGDTRIVSDPRFPKGEEFKPEKINLTRDVTPNQKDLEIREKIMEQGFAPKEWKPGDDLNIEGQKDIKTKFDEEEDLDEFERLFGRRYKWLDDVEGIEYDKSTDSFSRNNKFYRREDVINSLVKDWEQYAYENEIDEEDDEMSTEFFKNNIAHVLDELDDEHK